MIGAVELQPGTLLDGWQIVRPLRTGGFGAVHHAQQQGKAFAVKVALHREQSGDVGKTHARTLLEMSLLLTLDHPNIIKPRGFGYLPDGRAYGVLEYVEGWTLGEWKERTFPTFRELARVCATIAGAIEYMHARPRKVFHRDLKLSNVMISSSTGEPVIIDLGAATYENAEELTTTPLPPGTDRYRSPEAWEFYYQQRHNPGARYPFRVTDELFAMGVMLYELLTAPLPAKEPPRLDFASLRAAREVNPRVPEAWSALVEDLLAHDPAQRPVNFEALRRRLEELANHPGPEHAAEVHAPSAQRQPPHREGAHGKQGWRKVLAWADKQAARLRGRLQPRALVAGVPGSRQQWRKPLVVAGMVAAVVVAAAAAAWLTHGERPAPASVPAPKVATAPTVPTAPALPPVKSPPVSAPAPATAPKEGSTVKPKPPDAPKSPRAARALKAAPAPNDPGFPAWCKALPLALAMATEGCASIRIKAEPFECPPGAKEAMEKLGWMRNGIGRADLDVRLDERGPGFGVYTFTLGAPVTGVLTGADRGEVPAGSLLHGTVYKTDASPHAPLGELRVIYDHVEIPGKGKFPVCVVSQAQSIKELNDNKATAGVNVGALPVSRWQPPRD
ncbi:MAG: serine/threonine protein kinase [Hyalangium sp.]|uniref:serine/threonine protein kinase n=1 Tax=Hyalangium sp. TaxID=2028555 RepID=UPI00389B1323